MLRVSRLERLIVFLMILWLFSIGLIWQSNHNLKKEIQIVSDEVSSLKASSAEFDSASYQVMESTVAELQRYQQVFDDNVDVLNNKFADVDRRINAIVNYLTR